MAERRGDIDQVRGFAILLVVFGHLVARADPANVHWYEPLRRAVYAFHMPLFLYLSGLAAVLSGAALRPRSELPKVAGARARRLLVPFFGLGVATVLGKLLLGHVMRVDNAPAGFLAGLQGLFWDTGASPALSIWYLFVLFVVSLAAILVLNGRVGRAVMLVAGGLLLGSLPCFIGLIVVLPVLGHATWHLYRKLVSD